MKRLAERILSQKNKTIPVLSFPSTRLLGISVAELISSAEKQAEGMIAIYNRCNVGASLNMMDLSVEAEAFGAEVSFSENEIPTVSKGVIDDIFDYENIVVPAVGAGRTGVYIEGVKKAKEALGDVPVFCGVIGPYSLAGRLFDMTELMIECYSSPDEVEGLVSLCADFLIAYINEFKKNGADGVIMAEPSAGLLSPDLAEDFSAKFIKRIIDAVSDENFLFCYHNCGGAVVASAESIAKINADIYHFGNAIKLRDIIPLMPKDSIVMGNVDPMLFLNGTPEEICNRVQEVFNECSCFENFMLSSGCDIPADAKWENIDAYFNKVKELYA